MSLYVSSWIFSCLESAAEYWGLLFSKGHLPLRGCPHEGQVWKFKRRRGGGCPSLFVELPVFSTRKTPWRSWKINFWVFFFLSDVYFVFLHCPSLQIILFVSSPRFDVTRQEKDMRVLAQMLADAELELFHGQHLDPKIFKVIDGLVIQICKI